MIDLVELLSQDGVTIKKSGNGHVGLCPFHNEKTPSFSVDVVRGLYHCFGCGAEGDAVTYLQTKRGTSQKEALQMVKGPPDNVVPITSNKPDSREAPKKKFIAELPNYADSTHLYFDADKKLKFAVCRLPPTKNRKKKGYAQFTPAVTTSGVKGWVAGQAIKENRPLYRLPELLEAKKKQQVILVEGEKCADAVAGAFKSAVVTAWSGGTNAWDRSDLAPLFRRPVLLVADADDPGRKTMNDIGLYLRKNKCKVRIVLPEGDDGHDIADEISAGGTEQAAGWLTKLATDIKKSAPKAPPPEKKNTDDPPAQEAQVPKGLGENKFFTVLGNVNELVVVKLQTHIIVSLSRTAITQPSQLLAIAPDVGWWCTMLQVDSLSRPAAQHAGAALLKYADRLGQINLSRIIGRGVTVADDGEYVWHLGDRLLVKGEITTLNRPDKNIYVAGSEIDIDMEDGKLSQEVRTNITDTLMSYRWRNEQDGMRMLGWIVSSIIGGALDWRPNLWLLGQADQGKSWFLKHVVKPIFSSITVQLADPSGPSTARLIRSDSLPLIFDEAEPYQVWLDGIISLCRISAGGDGDRIRADGTSSGFSTFSPRFSALMSSTKLPRLQAADNSRYAMVQLSQIGIDDWPKLESKIRALFDPPSKLGKQIRSTIILQSEQLVLEAQRISKALMQDGNTGSRQAMIQGALSAGFQWWSGSDEIVNMQTPRIPEMDASEILMELLNIRVRTPQAIDTTLLALLATGEHRDITSSHGLSLASDGLLISPRHPSFKKAVKSTPWAAVDISQLLRQIPGVEYTKNPRRFGTHSRSRAVLIPFNICKNLGLTLSPDRAEQTDMVDS